MEKVTSKQVHHFFFNSGLRPKHVRSQELFVHYKIKNQYIIDRSSKSRVFVSAAETQGSESKLYIAPYPTQIGHQLYCRTIFLCVTPIAERQKDLQMLFYASKRN